MRRPPFCPHRRCPCHIDPDSEEAATLARQRWFKRDGYYDTLVRGEVARFRCLVCGRGFSEQTFSLDYYVKRIIDYRQIEGSLVTCRGVRATARSLGCSCDSVTNRTSRLARQSISAHARVVAELASQENFAADGFESFVVSQYFPNNIHLLVGSASQLLYFCDYVTIRRSGRMSEAQKRMRFALEHFYRAPPQALTNSFSELLDSLCSLLGRSTRRQVVLHTDKKQEYLRALKGHTALSEAIDAGTFGHQRTSSRALRLRSNPLFPVNYIDRELRKDLAEHVRETVRFARNVNHCMERLWIYLLNHNVRKRFRINDPVQIQRRHIGQAGVQPPLIARATARILERRRFLSFETLQPAQLKVWRRAHHTPLRDANRQLLRAVKKQARAGPVDVRAIMARLKIKSLTVNRPQYLPMYALA